MSNLLYDFLYEPSARNILLSKDYIQIQNILECDEELKLPIYKIDELFVNFGRGGIFFDSHDSSIVRENDLVVTARVAKNKGMILIAHDREEYNKALTNRIRNVFTIYHIDGDGNVII